MTCQKSSFKKGPKKCECEKYDYKEFFDIDIPTRLASLPTPAVPAQAVSSPTPAVPTRAASPMQVPPPAALPTPTVPTLASSPTPAISTRAPVDLAQASPAGLTTPVQKSQVPPLLIGREKLSREEILLHVQESTRRRKEEWAARQLESATPPNPESTLSKDKALSMLKQDLEEIQGIDVTKNMDTICKLTHQKIKLMFSHLPPSSTSQYDELHERLKAMFHSSYKCYTGNLEPGRLFVDEYISLCQKCGDMYSMLETLTTSATTTPAGRMPSTGQMSVPTAASTAAALEVPSRTSPTSAVSASAAQEQIAKEAALEAFNRLPVNIRNDSNRSFKELKTLMESGNPNLPDFMIHHSTTNPDNYYVVFKTDQKPSEHLTCDYKTILEFIIEKQLEAAAVSAPLESVTPPAPESTLPEKEALIMLKQDLEKIKNIRKDNPEKSAIYVYGLIHPIIKLMFSHLPPSSSSQYKDLHESLTKMFHISYQFAVKNERNTLKSFPFDKFMDKMLETLTRSTTTTPAEEMPSAGQMSVPTAASIQTSQAVNDPQVGPQANTQAAALAVPSGISPASAVSASAAQEQIEKEAALEAFNRLPDNIRNENRSFQDLKGLMQSGKPDLPDFMVHHSTTKPDDYYVVFKKGPSETLSKFKKYDSKEILDFLIEKQLAEVPKAVLLPPPPTLAASPTPDFATRPAASSTSSVSAPADASAPELPELKPGDILELLPPSPNADKGAERVIDKQLKAFESSIKANLPQNPKIYKKISSAINDADQNTQKKQPNGFPPGLTIGMKNYYILKIKSTIDAALKELKE